MGDYTPRERLWLWLNKAFGHFASKLYRFISDYGSIEEIYALARENGLPKPDYLEPTVYQTLLRDANDRALDAYISYLDEKGIRAITRASDNYPTLLSEIYDPPSVLFLKGTLPQQIELPIAIIGARKCTEYGRETAKKLAYSLSKRNACIVSGLAYGIDSTAALGAIAHKENEFPTIAVLGSGVDNVYPKSNLAVYRRIIDRGAVLSEFAPGTPPYGANFPIRNRVISGLAKGLIVVEAGEKSGTFITVNYALEQGRDVFSVPGRITDPMSAGTNRLIRQGLAKPVFGLRDILEEYGVMENEESMVKTVDVSKLDYNQALIYRLLLAGNRSFDELCEMTTLSAADLNCALTSLEFSEIIKQLPGRIYTV